MCQLLNLTYISWKYTIGAVHTKITLHQNTFNKQHPYYTTNIYQQLARGCRLVHNTYWFHHFIDIARVKSSLQFLDFTLLKNDKTHHMWPTIVCAVRASIRAKLISVSYILQTNRTAFNQHQVSDVCLLCGQSPEDMPHFISECPTLDFKRKLHIDNIKRLCMKLEIVLPKARQELCCAILNAGTPLICTHIDYKPDLYECNHINVFNRLRETVNYMCLYLHNQRVNMLAQLEASRPRNCHKGGNNTTATT